MMRVLSALGVALGMVAVCFESYTGNVHATWFAFVGALWALMVYEREVR